MRVSIHQGDCLDVLRTLPADSVDAVVTDPPAGIGFMGKSWDRDKGGRQQWIAWLAEIMTETRRVMKPGAYALVWALPRTSHWTGMAIEDSGLLIQDRISHLFGTGFPKSKTHLKPACEDWWLAYKPGKRALNVTACRIGTSKDVPASISRRAQTTCYGRFTEYGEIPGAGGHDPNQGRWPANVTHDGSVYGRMCRDGEASAARFFYCAKASKADRDEGLDELPEVVTGRYGVMGQGPNAKQTPSIPVAQRNHHPTCKSTELMRWLCRLITPPDGVIFDPFMGSGSTGKAAVIEGFGFIGIEQDAEYAEIARARIAWAQGPLFAEVAP